MGWTHLLKLIYSERLPKEGMRELGSSERRLASVKEVFRWNTPFEGTILMWSLFVIFMIEPLRVFPKSSYFCPYSLSATF